LRVELTSKEQFQNVLQYIQQHPLRGKKVQVFAVWKPLTNSYITSRLLTSDPNSLKQKVATIKTINQTFKTEKSVITLFQSQADNINDL
jgi:hypothetical protein